MKINLPLLSLLFSFGIASSQNLKEQQNIIKSYNGEKTNSLLSRVEKNKKIRDAKIDLFLKSNPDSKVQFYREGTLYQIVDIIDGVPAYRTTDNALSAQASKINKLHPGGGMNLNLEGNNMTVGVWDGGWALGTHTEFLTAAGSGVSRVTFPDAGIPNPTSNDHATHVAGTVGARGANSAAKGMAPKVNLRSYHWDNDESEVINEAFNNALLVSNHSYGVPVINNQGVALPAWYMGCYSDTAVEWDEIHYTHPFYLMVASAGNSGTQTYVGGLGPNLDKLTGEKNSKNNLVIANANPTVNSSGALTALSINAGSSQGPSDDGRIKPDIAADGTNLLSTYNFSDNDYATLTGTSMAAPTISGALILLQEHYNNVNVAFMRSSTLKGLVCHTAFDDAALNIFAAAGPDPRFGWGLLDAQAAAETITKDAAGQALILESTLDANNPTYTMTFSVSDATNLKATLCWLDPAGTPKNGSVNSTVPALVNDLDLRISKGSQTYLPWKLNLSNLTAGAIKGDNLVDNVEKVEVDASAGGGVYTVTVSHKSFLINDSQAFSLILTGNGVTLNRDENKIKAISIYPNPAKDMLNFSIEDLTVINEIAIIDITGKVITPRYDLNSKTIDVSNLQAGVYFVRFASENGTMTKKFVKL